MRSARRCLRRSRIPPGDEIDLSRKSPWLHVVASGLAAWEQFLRYTALTCEHSPALSELSNKRESSLDRHPWFHGLMNHGKHVPILEYFLQDSFKPQGLEWVDELPYVPFATPPQRWRHSSMIICRGRMDVVANERAVWLFYWSTCAFTCSCVSASAVLGRENQNVAPAPTCPSAQARPPCLWMIL